MRLLVHGSLPGMLKRADWLPLLLTGLGIVALLAAGVLSQRAGDTVSHSAEAPVAETSLPPPPALDSGAVTAGAALYATHCAACHGVAGVRPVVCISLSKRTARSDMTHPVESNVTTGGALEAPKTVEHDIPIYLASDEARYVTGVAFNIDGGQMT